MNGWRVIFGSRQGQEPTSRNEVDIIIDMKIEQMSEVVRTWLGVVCG